MSAAFASARAALAAMGESTLTSEKLVGDCLARIEAREPEVGAWSYLDAEAALAQARARDSAGHRGALAGLPIGVKDLFDTCDMPTTYGSPIYADHRPSIDAAVVALIKRAGGVILGKTVTTEFAMFTPGKTANPHNVDHTPGGSSSGSAAAVADGMVPLALGTQTAGSIIRPAAFCGVVGYKPSFDLIAPAGVKCAAWTLDTIGVFARDVPDAALFAEALSGQTLTEASPARAPRVGLCHTPQWPAADADTRTALAEAERRIIDAGASVVPVELPASFDGLLDAQYVVMAYELNRALTFERETGANRISDRLATLLEEGGRLVGADYAQAQRLRRACVDQLGALFADVDVLLAPSAPGAAPKRSDGTGDPVFNRIWTLLGTPCVNVPGLVGRAGLPVGVQVIGAPQADARTLAAARWLEACLSSDFPG